MTTLMTTTWTTARRLFQALRVRSVLPATWQQLSTSAAPVWANQSPRYRHTCRACDDKNVEMLQRDSTAAWCAGLAPVELNAAEQAQFALHRKSMAQSVSKVLLEAGLPEFNNLSNPLYGTQQSVTASLSGLLVPPPSSIPTGPGATYAIPPLRVLSTMTNVVAAAMFVVLIGRRVSRAGPIGGLAHSYEADRHSHAYVLELAGAPLSPISENTHSRQWQSTDTLRQSKGPAPSEDTAPLDRKLSSASRPSTGGSDRSRHEQKRAPLVADLPRPGSGYTSGALGASGAGRMGDMDSFMEEMLSKERPAFREQHRLKRSVASSRHSGALRRSDGARGSEYYAAE